MTRSGAGALQLHVAERSDVLVDGLAQLLRTAPADPFTPDLVAVPTRGVERWVAQRLSHTLGAGDAAGVGKGPGGDGICAGVRFDPPRALVGRVLAATLGLEPADDPWRPDRLTWQVLAVLDEGLDAAVRHLGTPEDEVRRGRRVRLAQRLAGLLTTYDEQRPSLVRAWAAGGPTLDAPAGDGHDDPADDDGAGSPLPADLAWQAELWRRVRDRVGAPAPAERIGAAVARLEQDPGAVDLPERLSVFGATALPEAHVRVLAALARHRAVHLWLPHPSRRLWDRVAEAATGAADRSGAPRRRRDLPRVAHHPVLASMASDATELEVRLLAQDPAVAWLPAAPAPGTVLGALQAAIRADERDGARHRAAADDRTVQVHACHGRTRQVEVLRDVLVGLLADDPTLQPRDVVVLCPDVEAFAPLLEAVFGPAPADEAPGSHPGRTLRVRVADRAPARANPVLATLARVLELAGSRVTASAVVDLAGQAPVRRRFRFEDEDLERVRAWALETGVHWGEDATRRARYRLGAVVQGTWSAALDRLLLGVAMAEEDDRYVGAVLPVDDVASTDVELAGRLAELVDRLSGVLAELDGARPADRWFDTLDRALELLTDVAPADRWQRLEAARVLTDARVAAAAGGTPLLRLPDVVALLEPRLRGRPTRSGFRTGALTVCSLEPMRAVPHRVVALLGLDDAAFPRGRAVDGDDVLARDPLVGERDRRQEDRQLFLDAVLSARDHLVVVHAGADERTGAPRPPAVPVGELLDALDAAVAHPAGDARARVVRHPLQTVDERNFTDGALGRPGPFAFDALDLAAARAGRDRRPGGPAAPAATAGGPKPVDAFLPHPLAPRPLDPDVDLDELATTLEHPVRAFVRRRLGVVLPRDEPQLEDRLPLEVDGLQRWAVGDRLLAAGLAGADLDRTAAAERRRGHLPPAGLGGAALADVRRQVEPLLTAAQRHVQGPASSLGVQLVLPDGRSLLGTVHGVHGDVLARAVYSRLGPKHRLRAWVGLLALAAAHPGRTFTAVTVGRGDADRGPGRPLPRAARLTAPAAPDALTVLAGLVELADEALVAPLPLPLGASWAYARRRLGGADEEEALAAARGELGTAEAAANGRGGFESVDPHHLLVGRGEVRWTDVVAEPPSARDRERAPGESTRFGALAVALWAALDAHEELGLG